jgi:hypothetical protein
VNEAPYIPIRLLWEATNGNYPSKVWVQSVEARIENYKKYIETGATSIAVVPLDLYHIIEYVSCLQDEISRLNQEK